MTILNHTTTTGPTVHLSDSDEGRAEYAQGVLTSASVVSIHTTHRLTDRTHPQHVVPEGDKCVIAGAFEPPGCFAFRGLLDSGY